MSLALGEERLMDTLTGVLVALAVALLAAFVSERFIEAARRRRAYQRIVREPLIHVGAVLERLEISGRETPLVGRCRITSLAVGRMEVQSLDLPPVAMSFTGREFEALHPVVARERR